MVQFRGIARGLDDGAEATIEVMLPQRGPHAIREGRKRERRPSACKAGYSFANSMFAVNSTLLLNMASPMPAPTPNWVRSTTPVTLNPATCFWFIG